MRMSGLTLDSLPPIHIPFRFFLTTPWFAMLGAVIYGPLTAVAGLALLLDFGWLAFLTINAALLYAGTRRRIAAMEAD